MCREPIFIVTINVSIQLPELTFDFLVNTVEDGGAYLAIGLVYLQSYDCLLFGTFLVNNNAIRKLVLASGAVTTVAGQTGVAGSADGPVSQAQFHFPSGLGLDAAGNLYVADIDNDTLRMISPSGAVSTLAGLAGVSGSTDGTGTAAQFNFPTGVAADSAGDVYLADTNNHTIRLAVVPIGPSITVQPQNQTVTAGASVTFSVTATGKPAPTYQWLFNDSAISGATSSTLTLNNVQTASAGYYSVSVTNSTRSMTSNEAQLTVNSAGSGSSGGGGGGGGGGAPSVWFCSALLILAAARRTFPPAALARCVKISPDSSSRIEIVDALRGSALFGILLLHSIEHWDFLRYPVNAPDWLETSTGTRTTSDSFFSEARRTRSLR